MLTPKGEKKSMVVVEKRVIELQSKGNTPKTQNINTSWKLGDNRLIF
jgi:hypothetical protein